MSSQKSLALADVAAALEQALSDVAEQTFCGFTERYAPPAFAELLERSGEQQTAWLRAELAFAGPFDGALAIDVPESLAGELLSSCLGLDLEAEAAAAAPAAADRPGPEDAVGEFANMVCGAWLTRTYGTEKFDLRPPRLERLEPSASRGRWAEEPAPTLLMSLNDRPLRLRLIG